MAGETDLKIVGEAADGFQAIRLVIRLKPRLLISGVAMLGLNGLDVAKRVREVSKQTAVLIVSRYGRVAYVLRALRNGASGYVMKDAKATELTRAIRIVEHALRAVEFIRTGTAPLEIKSVAGTVKVIEGDTTVPEPLRYLVPRVGQMAIYEVRSKRGAVHVKDVDPRHIDANLAVHAAAWVLAEFLRLYHSSDERVVAEAMAALMRGHVRPTGARETGPS